jgi:NAD(P)H-dependent flavin oxidoreductase YrpB (nitropropane dioxygenase family)
MTKQIPSLKIGNLEINPPIIQGGMGVRVSMSGLAAAVANEGCAGIIASVGLGDFENAKPSEFVKVNNDALRSEIRKARSNSKGVIGVNVMVVLSNYEELVRVCVEEKVDMLICGSGLPMDLPKLTAGSGIKLVPIVSSARAFNIIYRKWKQNYQKVPDAVILEGPLAGGHLGYKLEEVSAGTTATLEVLVKELVDYCNTIEDHVPVIAAGGIYTGEDITKFLKIGASGVQMATRFVCTDECDVDDDFKQAYIKAGKDDITIIKSPVGLPGRVIKNEFVERINAGETVPFKCPHHCLQSCNPRLAPFCIAKALASASRGDFLDAFVFAGANAYRCTEVVSVKELVDELKRDMLLHL